MVHSLMLSPAFSSRSTLPSAAGWLAQKHPHPCLLNQSGLRQHVWGGRHGLGSEKWVLTHPARGPGRLADSFVQRVVTGECVQGRNQHERDHGSHSSNLIPCLNTMSSGPHGLLSSRIKANTSVTTSPVGRAEQSPDKTMSSRALRASQVGVNLLPSCAAPHPAAHMTFSVADSPAWMQGQLRCHV